MRHRKRWTAASVLAVCACSAVVPAMPAAAQVPQSGTSALTAQLDQVCAGAASGSALAARCATILASSNPDARAIAADHNDLEELPGAGRGAAKDQWPSREEVDTLLTPRLALFASIDHDHAYRRDDTIEAAFDSDSTTFTLGLDWHPAKRWQLGITLNRSHENQQFRGSLGRTQSDTTGLIAVSSFDLDDHFVLDGYLGKSWGSQDIRRVVSFVDNSAPVAETASPGLGRSLGGLALEASFPHGSWVWQGSLGLDAARTSVDAYNESGGSGFDMAVPQRSVSTQRGRLEFGLADTVSASWGVWQPELRVGLLHEFANDERSVGVRFLDDTSGTIVRFDTGAPDRDWVQATFSSTFTLPHGNSGFFTVGREFGHSTSTATTYAIGWRIEL